MLAPARRAGRHPRTSSASKARRSRCNNCAASRSTERAAALARLVLWISWLQWRIRLQQRQPGQPVIPRLRQTSGTATPCSPGTADRCATQPARSSPRWDGKRVQDHPATGEQVPDRTALVPQWRYLNPPAGRVAAGGFIIRQSAVHRQQTHARRAGDGYVGALRGSWPAVPGRRTSSCSGGSAPRRRSVRGERGALTDHDKQHSTMTSSRRACWSFITAAPPLTIAWAVWDHPWVDSAQMVLQFV